jgi:hypothetical protein
MTNSRRLCSISVTSSDMLPFGEGQHVYSRQRDNLADSSGPDSDRFEELFVNPALITLARQRGDLDCGGIRYLVVAYGNFTQLVVPTTGGHLSVALDRRRRPNERLAGLEPPNARRGVSAAISSRLTSLTARMAPAAPA